MKSTLKNRRNSSQNDFWVNDRWKNWIRSHTSRSQQVHAIVSFSDSQIMIFFLFRISNANLTLFHLPISKGIGQKFAFLEIKSIVSKILRNFEIVLTNESEMYPVLSAELVLRPESSISFYFKPRIYWIIEKYIFVKSNFMCLKNVT